MRPARPLVLVFSVLVLALLLGATCEELRQQQPICPLVCEHGYKTDLTGTEFCECREGDACILIVSEPHFNPVTHECVTFPTVCDVPRGWEPCGPGCQVGDRFVPVGETIPAGDGCNQCTCTRAGVLACTEIACPGCLVDGEFHERGDTFPAGDGCNICICREDGHVACTLRPCPICPPPEPTSEELCERTEGTWDEDSCGHYRCGEFPFCDAIIPGCNCGPDRNFREGLGCVKDPACRDGCGPGHECPPGSECNPCPPDPSCPLCAVCGPPVCESISCRFEEDCPPGSRCEGSSVCPPDVTCVWEGKPGICVPDDECCDPRQEPGVGENPICFEGATCCADGRWACNHGDGTPSCEELGRVCD
jgi:hypothetical protein